MANAVTVILPAPAGTSPERFLAGLRSVLEQTHQRRDVLVALETDGGAEAPVRGALEPFAKSLSVVEVGHSTPGALRNAVWARARGAFVLVVEPDETLASKDALARQVAALEGDPAAAASYGQTAVTRASGTRLRPSRGRGGRIQRRLVQQKELIASSASVLWRKDALPKTPYDEVYHAPASLLLALSLAVAGERPFLYLPVHVASAATATESLEALEEKAKIFVALLYGPRPLDEKLEQRVRFRLARHLVAIGKHHYRGGDHIRAGKFFSEAVKSAPSYFKGRRYQFLNFVKQIIARV